jgi:hypothetical protein
MPSPHRDIYFLLLTVTLLLLGIGVFVGNSLGITSIGKSDYITVGGSAYGLSANEIATLNAGVTVINSDKAAAVKIMNERMDNIVASIKKFGIPAEDIKTSNYSIYQDQTWDPGTSRTVFGDWRANTSIDITIRNVDKASSLADLLSTLEVDNVFGPSFTTDNQNPNETKLLILAMENARVKAEQIARASGRSLGKMTSFIEGGSNAIAPMYARGMGGGGGADLQPGSTEVGRSVTVTYILR